MKEDGNLKSNQTNSDDIMVLRPVLSSLGVDTPILGTQLSKTPDGAREVGPPSPGSQSLRVRVRVERRT